MCEAIFLRKPAIDQCFCYAEGASLNGGVGGQYDTLLKPWRGICSTGPTEPHSLVVAGWVS